jgi:hypothetical protein
LCCLWFDDYRAEEKNAKVLAIIAFIVTNALVIGAVGMYFATTLNTDTRTGGVKALTPSW